MNQINLIEAYKDKLGIKIIPKPYKYQIEKVQEYTVGLFKELTQLMIGINKYEAVEIKNEALSASNISTLHQNCKKEGYKLHCLRSGDKRILYVEKL